MLTRYHGRMPLPAPAPGSWAATAVELPALTGARVAVLGLHHREHGTILHLHAGGITMEAPAHPVDPRQRRPLASSVRILTRVPFTSNATARMCMPASCPKTITERAPRLLRRAGPPGAQAARASVSSGAGVASLNARSSFFACVTSRSP